MIELQKHVLNQVYQNQDLFSKELLKAKRWLNSSELEQLKSWLQQDKFKKHHQLIKAMLTDSYQLAS
ncbi:hypothetical protein [Wenyingzhuangia aestuarii]|uniref:hypothetical protein n=1 Tax=Wenyingzhuangia aestuarii TaxID=1647582 RepID=UPI00143941A1|nr:hypothetical protein [Wenyingzhuangia aestuarii]NJB82211.1 hypothetical protein [Wenyingzhuangia aestuarii]